MHLDRIHHWLIGCDEERRTVLFLTSIFVQARQTGTPNSILIGVRTTTTTPHPTYLSCISICMYALDPSSHHPSIIIRMHDYEDYRLQTTDYRLQTTVLGTGTGSMTPDSNLFLTLYVAVCCVLCAVRLSFSRSSS